ncbi:MAG: hypothetical protein WC529_06755 [Candidatus Margulisiibacteriota bacterium]
MKTKTIALVLLMTFSLGIAAQAAPPTATDRIKNMANEESAWRWGSGLIKLAVGGAVTAAGYSLFAIRDNLFVALATIPLGITIMVPGVVVMGWGGYDLLFGSREYENEYDKLKLSTDPAREDLALQYLKTKSEQDKQSRQPSFWNAFGLFSMFETPAEREYNGYLKEQGAAK